MAICELRRKIQTAMSRHVHGDLDAAGIAVCFVLEDIGLGLQGNGWFAGDEDLENPPSWLMDDAGDI